MLTDSLPTNARSSLELSPSRPPQAGVPIALERGARPSHDERVERKKARPPYHDAAPAMVNPIMEFSPSGSVKRRIATWPGMAAEIVQATRHDRIESRF